MHIIQLSTYDALGGAARAAYRLHHSLCREGVDSRMIVQRRLGTDVTVRTAGTGIPKRVLLRLAPRLDHLPLSLYPNRDTRNV